MARHTITFKEGNCKLRFDDYIKITFNTDSSGGDTAAINNHDYPMYVAYKDSVLRYLDAGEIVAGQTVVGQFKGNKIILYASDFPSSGDGPVDPSVKRSMWLYRNTMIDYPSIYQYIYLKPYMTQDDNIVNPNSTYTISFGNDSLNNIDESARKKIAAIVFDDVRNNGIRRIVPLVDTDRKYLTINDVIEAMTYANDTNNISVVYTEYVKHDNFMVAAFVARAAHAKEPTANTKLVFNYAKNLTGTESVTYGSAVTQDITTTVTHDYMGHGTSNADEDNTIYTLSGFCDRKMPTSIHIVKASSTDKDNGYNNMAHSNGSKIHVLGLYKSTNGEIINPKNNKKTDINIARVAKSYKIAKFDGINLASDEDSTIGVNENYWLLPDLNSLINIYNHLVNNTELIEPTESELHSTSNYKYKSSNNVDINALDGITIYCANTPDDSVINIIRDINNSTTGHLKINLIDGGRSLTKSRYATELFNQISVFKSNSNTDKITVFPWDNTWTDHMLEKKLLVKGNTLDVLRTKLSGQVNYDKVLNESNTATVETVLIGLDDFSNFEAKYKELKKVYTVNATHKLEFFDSRYNILNDDITPSNKTSDDIEPTDNHRYNIDLNSSQGLFPTIQGTSCLPSLSKLEDGDIIYVTFNQANINTTFSPIRVTQTPVMFACKSYKNRENMDNFTYPLVDENMNYIPYDAIVGGITLKLKFRHIISTANEDFGYFLLLSSDRPITSHIYNECYKMYPNLDIVTGDNYILAAESDGSISLHRDDTFDTTDLWPHPTLPSKDNTRFINVKGSFLHDLIPYTYMVYRVIVPVQSHSSDNNILNNTTPIPMPNPGNRLRVFKRDKKVEYKDPVHFYTVNVHNTIDFAKYTVEQYCIIQPDTGISDTVRIYPSVRNLINYYTRKKQGRGFNTDLQAGITVHIGD